jgi:S-adenosylmethionine:tRNA ribosyltransferase-isomerase
MKLKDFSFELPKELIAEHPIRPRHNAKMLEIGMHGLVDRHVYDLPDLLKAGDLLVLNDSKVIPTKFIAKRGEAKIKLYLNKKIDDSTWIAFAKPAKKLRIGDRVDIGDDFQAEIVDKLATGEVKLQFIQAGNFYDYLFKYGEMPLPPYIKRETTDEDTTDYQTVYATKDGSVAVPSAGLHFTDELFAKLDKKGIKWAFTTLHVGPGTFLPVKVKNILDHEMHSELCYLDADTVDLIKKTKREGGRIIAVGSTAVRVLETAARPDGELKPFAGETDIFITPGFDFKVVDALISNFHMPETTLMMLVSAFTGLKKIKNAYKHAIKNKYRLLSYGDCCFIHKDT